MTAGTAALKQAPPAAAAQRRGRAEGSNGTEGQRGTRAPSASATRRHSSSTKTTSTSASSATTMLKWDSWNESLDAAKLDAETRGEKLRQRRSAKDTTATSTAADAEDDKFVAREEDFAAQFARSGDKLSGKVRSAKPEFTAIRDHIRKYSRADRWLAYRTLAVTLVLYYTSQVVWPLLWKHCGPESADGGLCYAKYGTAWRALWTLVRGLICVRVFIVFHDACHLSFLPTPKENRWLGRLIGALCMTPYDYWRGTHVLHHRVYGNSALYDPARTIKFTTQQYAEMTWWKKALCRFFRDPFVFFVVAPVMLFLVVYRFMRGGIWVNLYKAIEMPLMYYLSGGETVWLRDELCAASVAGAVGFMLFHLQHHVNISYYEPPEQHTVEEASIYGSTYLYVPWFLKWVTLGIEYHHIHHFSMRVPCYTLQRCHEEAPKGMWKDVPTLPYHKSLRGLFNAMWNPERYRYESFWPYESALQATLGE